MKLQKTKLGFTLIELLVVITIIGILATGAVWVYTSQIQKARDTTRITDMDAVRGSIEQAFQDMGMYPWNATTIAASSACDSSATVSTSWIYCIIKLWFLNALPKDPKSSQSWNGSPLEYTYNFWDVNWVVNQAFEVSTAVESDWFKSSKATSSADGWDDDSRIEFWTLKDWSGTDINTCLNGSTDNTCTGWNSVTWKIPASTASCTLKGTSVLIRWNCL